MPILPEQRVAVFIDVQNMYYSARALYQAKVDFGKVIEHVVRGRRPIRQIAYVIRTDSVEMEQSFFDALEARGLDIKEKDLQVFYGGAKKGDWDVGIAMDIVRYAAKVDAIVLVSGDGDFTDLLKYVKAHGCRAEAAAFMESSSSMLREEADEFINLSELRNEILISNKRRRDTGGSQNGSKEKMETKKQEHKRPDVPKIPKRRRRKKAPAKKSS